MTLEKRLEENQPDRIECECWQQRRRRTDEGGSELCQNDRAMSVTSFGVSRIRGLANVHPPLFSRYTEEEMNLFT